MFDEYSLAYQFKKRGRWYISDERFSNLTEAKRDLEIASNLQIHGPHWAKNWKIVRRNVSRWIDVKSEVSNEECRKD